jgi:hypothetical protein
MKINSHSINKLLVELSLFLFLFVNLPIITVASTNYGEGNYNEGYYNLGSSPTAAPESSANNNNSSDSSAGAPSCNESVTGGLPDLFEIRTSKDKATLYFAPPAMPYSNFYIAFSKNKEIWEYGTQYDQDFSPGVLVYTINLLKPNTKYYFKIRPGNKCAPGKWGNIMAATTTNSAKTKTYYKNYLTTVIQQTKQIISKIAPGKKSENTPTIAPSPTTAQLNKPGTQFPTFAPIPTPVTQKNKFCFFKWCF